MASVTFEGVRKEFGGVAAVEDFDLHVADGELVVLVGGSGCGKSTILRMLAGLEEPTAGTIRIGERDVTDLPPRERDVAMVFQDYALYPHLTARDNISLGLKLRKLPKEEIERRVRWAGEMLELEPFLDRKPKAMSGGQRQRVAMGRAMVREPAVFLFDEPLSNLDAHLRSHMRQEIARLRRRVGTTTLYVTHDQAEAMTLADRLVVLDRGRIQQVGRPIDVYRAPANRFVAGFIGTPSMNFLEGRIEPASGGAGVASRGAGGGTEGRGSAGGGAGQDRALDFVSDGVRLGIGADRGPHLAPGTGERVTLGVRPEDLALAEDPGRASLRGELLLAEILGATMHLHLEVAGRRWIAAVPTGPPPATGTTVGLSIDPVRLHFFAADGSSLARADAADRLQERRSEAR